MNKAGQINQNPERIFLPLSKKESLQKSQKAPSENKNKRSAYPDVRMPKQPDGFLKAKKHTIF
jgi:hypothetical protein